MRKPWLSRFLSVLLVAALVVGQVAPVMAMPVSGKVSVFYDAMAQQDSKDCRPDCDKDGSMKSTMCSVICMSAAQATLPTPFPSIAFHAVALSYERVDTAAIGMTLIPDSPPPKT